MSSFRELQHTFAASETSAFFKLEPGETADYNVAGTFTGRVDLEQSDSPGTHVETLIQGTANTGYSGTLINDKGDARWYRFHAQSWTGGTALAELWTSSLVGVQEIHGEDRIGIVRGAAVIFTTPAAALLLSAPRAGLDDGKELTIIDGSGYAAHGDNTRQRDQRRMEHHHVRRLDWRYRAATSSRRGVVRDGFIRRGVVECVAPPTSRRFFAEQRPSLPSRQEQPRRPAGGLNDVHGRIHT